MRQFYLATIGTLTSTILFMFPSIVLAESAIQLGQRVRYSGPFTNTTYNLSGDVVIEVEFESENRISGYINFTNYPGVRTLCGAGKFIGTRQARTLQFSFVSNDPERDCGFDRGWKFIVSANLSRDYSVLENGRYQVGDVPGAGVFTASSAIKPTLKEIGEAETSPAQFQVPHGQLTFDTEGQECPDIESKCNRYHSRKPHVPDSLSGVTIGRGYDLKRRTPSKIKSDLIAAGLTKENAEAYAKAGCKIISNGSCEPQFIGNKARKFVDENQDKLVEITPEQQRKIFEVTYSEMEEDVKRISNNTKDKYGAVDFDALNPKIRDILVDLRFRGDYTTESRELIQKYAADNNFSAFKGAMGNEYWLNKLNPVPRDRFNRRLEYLDN